MIQLSFFNKKQIVEDQNDKEIQFRKLEKKIASKEKIHQERILAMQTKIDQKMLSVNDKYQLRKAKNLQRYEYKLKTTETNYEQKIALIETKQADYQVKPQKYNNYRFSKLQAKKIMLNQFWQKDKLTLKTQFDKEDEQLENWFHQKLNDYKWDFQNFVENYTKNRDEYQANSIYKINYFYDRRFFNSEYQRQSKLLKKQIKAADDNQLLQEAYQQKSNLVFDIVTNNQLTYKPLSFRIVKQQQAIKNYFNLIPVKFKNKLHDLSYITFKDIIRLKLFEIPLLLYLASATVIILALIFHIFSAETMGAIALLFLIAIIGGETLNRVPIWKTYLGGGTMGVFFIGAILGTFNLIPANVVSSVKVWFIDGGFLNLYINVLIVGSILTIPQKLILRSFTGFIGLLFASAFFALIGAALVTTILDLPWKLTVLKIILPLLSDGNGGGVQPLSAMSESYHYLPYHEYMSFALAVSSVSNIFVIIIAAIITTLFTKSPTLSGNGKLVKKPIHLRDQTMVAQDRHIAAALFLCCTIYILCKLLETALLKVTGININAFAWAVGISLLINLANVLPKTLKAGFNRLNQFFSKQFTWFLMAGVGLTLTNLKIFASLFTNWEYLALILVMDLCLLIGPFLVARLIKFYALESMIAAGCCLGAQGGAGSIAVLGASQRMELLPYSQITCRIGGGLVLIIAAPIFLWFQ